MFDVIDFLYDVLFWTTIVGFIITGSLMIFVEYKYYKKKIKGHMKYDKFFLLIVLLVSLFVLGFMFNLLFRAVVYR